MVESGKSHLMHEPAQLRSGPAERSVGVKASFVAVKFLPAQNNSALYGFVWPIQWKMMAGVKI